MHLAYLNLIIQKQLWNGLLLFQVQKEGFWGFGGAHAFLHVQSSGQHTLDDYSAAEADAREWLHFGWKQSEPGDLFDEFELDDWLGANAEELESD